MIIVTTTDGQSQAIPCKSWRADANWLTIVIDTGTINIPVVRIVMIVEPKPASAADTVKGG